MIKTTSSLKALVCLGAAAVVTLTGACAGSSPSTSTTPFDPGAPLVQFSTSHFAGAGNCAQCHSNLKDASGKDVSIDTQWRSTMMANAARDPYFLAKVASEAADLPALKSAIEDACAICHMPMARTQAVSDGTTVSVLGNGFLSASNSLNKAALDGNSCTLCHQIQSSGLGTPDTFDGKYVIDTSTKAPNRIAFGHYANPLIDPMQSVVGFTPALGEQTNSAGLCGTCHTVYTPFVDSQGNVKGTFPEQTPYMEWANSIYGSNPAQQLACQFCHMPLASGPVAISNNPTTITPRSTFYQHGFIGGSSLILNIMSSHVSDLKLSASTEQMLATSQLTSTQLGTRSGQVSVVSSVIENGVMKVTLSVSDQTGHKFPTGFPSRRVWIQFTVTDSSGKVVFESGKPNADGRISGNDADSKTGAYEPHYNLITRSDQVQIYESIMSDTDGKVTYNLLRAASYLKDNRLLPTGFNKATAPPDAGVYGDALNDANFIGGSDQVTYQISLSGKGTYIVTARLLYQTISYQFAKAFLGSDALVKSFLGYYQAADKTPNLVSSVSKTLG
ncbi:MAG: hypothetical protein C4542_01185 [Dehalococcoidia bacterium]|nr:MAG: hypothetical protein C4542_01185 [Dehalococcoidia bacterium]